MPKNSQLNWHVIGAVIGSFLFLFLLIKWATATKETQLEPDTTSSVTTQCPECPVCPSPSLNDSSLAQKTRAAVAETRKIFPIHSLVTIKSKNSGKYLQFVEESKAKANPDLRSEAGLVLEATGEDANEKAAQWRVLDLLPFQPMDAQGITVRLQNNLYETFLREVELAPLAKAHTLGRPQYTFQSGIGSQISSPIVAAETPEGVLIAGYTMFRTTGQPTLTVQNPFLLRATIEGLILPPPQDSIGKEAFWQVNVIE